MSLSQLVNTHSNINMDNHLIFTARCEHVDVGFASAHVIVFRAGHFDLERETFTGCQR